MGIFIVHIVFYLLLIVLTYLLVNQYQRYAIKKAILDHPNQRSSHKVATPRGGGLVIALLWLFLGCAGFYFYDVLFEDWLVFFVPGVLIFLIGYLDDRYQVRNLWRFLTQIVASVIAIVLFHYHPKLTIAYNVQITSIVWVYGSLFLAFLWSTNLFNFLDGLDGYASTEAIFIFTLTGFIAYHSFAVDVEIAYLAWMVSALCIGFLLLNWPPAKIFMGDVASGFLGFLFVIFAYYLSAKAQVSILLFVYMYSLFWFDATITLIRRICHGDKWYESHNLHAYQRLHQAGYSHLQVLMCNITLNIIIAVLVLWAYFEPEYLPLVGIVELILLTACYLIVERIKPMYEVSHEKN